MKWKKPTEKCKPIVVIEWVDSSSASDSGWRRLDEYDPDVATCMTAGFLITETKSVVMVVTSVASTGQVHSPISIPKCAITRRKRIA